jgi:Probable cobalt transporter subunit (CbtB)
LDGVRREVEPIEVPVVAWLALAVGLLVLYVVLQENGALLAGAWHDIHEFFHDGRHFLGVPCH